MSLFTSVRQQAANITQKALRLGGDFAHPVSDDSSNGPDYAENNALAANGEISLPNTAEWGPGYPTTTLIDSTTGLLTTKTEGNPPLDEGMSIYDIYADRAERMGDEPLYTYKDDSGKWVTSTANETLADIRSVAKGLLHYGLKKGDGVAFMCRTSYAWDVTDAAIMACGGVLATIYDTDSAEQIRNIVNNSDARLLIVETADMRDKAEGAIEECPSLETILCIETGGLEEIKAYGAAVSDEELDERIDSIKKTDLCSIVYTSGSTAAPKGVEMTHEHYCTTALNLPVYMPDLLHNKKNSVLLFLPQAHSFARAINYICVASNIRIYIAQGIKTLITDLQVARPSVMIVVPRVLEKVSQRGVPEGRPRAEGRGVRRRGGRRAELHEGAGCQGQGRCAGQDPPRRLRPDRLQDAARRARRPRPMDRRRRRPLDPELLAFFRGANVPVYEGYGLTETTAPCAFNPLGVPYHQGSVGIAFPGFELRVAEDEEIQVKGTAVFPKYHKNEEATEGSFTDDGWYRTGDLGRLDNDGFLYITGRKKDLIITAGGKNVAPGPIEEVIQRCEFVSQVLVLGDKRPFISALVTLDEKSLRPWLESKGLNRDMTMEEAASNAAVRAEVQKWVDQANEGVSRAESVRKFIILPEEFSQENGLLTASMKVIRPKVIRRYATLLNTQMYTKKK